MSTTSEPRTGVPPLSAARWDDSRFDAERARILGSWRTGADVDLADAAAFHASRPPLANVPRKREWARRTGHLLLQPYGGVTTLQGQIELIRHVAEVGTADIVPTTIDSQTRNLAYAAAEKALAESERQGKELLNGFPIVNHGVARTRELVQSVEVPVEMRIGTVTPQLAVEIGFAGGMSSVTAGPIYYTAHYSRDTSFAETIANWQYVFRLIGRYAELGVPIGLQIHGVGTSTPFPNTLLGACCVLETLIAAAQGARSFSLDARLMGNLVQDVAGVRAIREVAEDWVCRRFGYADAVITIDRKSWSGRYPEDMASAYGIVCYNAVSAMLAGADEIIANSVQEGVGIPLKESNADTLKALRQIAGMMRGQGATLKPEPVDHEVDMMKREMDAILEAVMDLGHGDPAVATELGFKHGLIDIPFAASRQCRNEVMVARDAAGAVRYLDAGSIPVPADVLAYHKECLERRAAARGRPIDYQTIADDIFSISLGHLVMD
jgi:methylaspartate mutase epsilon subunit